MITRTTAIELNKRDPDIHGFYWASKILPLVSSITSIKFLSIKMPNVVATDGNRIHIYSPHEKYPSGLYRVLIKNKTHIFLSKITSKETYPKWKPIVPNTAVPYLEKIKLRGNLSIDYTNLILALTKIHPSHTLDINYFKDLIYETWDAFIYEKYEGIRFEGDRRVAVIMPVHR